MSAVIVTGSNGGVGSSICIELKAAGYKVIGIDKYRDKNNLDHFVEFDLETLVNSKSSREEISNKINTELDNNKLFALVNNAAVQLLNSFENISFEEFSKSININLTVPFILSKLVFFHLKSNSGSIVNIGSIHSSLTKPRFVSYSTSKSALMGLTKSLAVDCGEFVRVNAIQPAATRTEMLVAGFRGHPEMLDDLRDFHPTRSIAEPTEIASAVMYLISKKNKFCNGSILELHGGIGARLHDPG